MDIHEPATRILTAPSSAASSTVSHASPASYVLGGIGDNVVCTMIVSHGYIYGDGRFLKVRCFATNQETVYDAQADAPPTQLAGHRGGDLALVSRFIDAVGQRSPGYILSGPQASLESHRVVFATERSRQQSQIIQLSQE